MKQDITTVFTDGSSRGNPGPGGWGTVVLYATGIVRELGGYAADTTNNRMELTAAHEALYFLEQEKYDREIIICTDSTYLLNGITGWVFAWEKNGWKTKTGERVENRDIWEALLGLTYRLNRKNKITWQKVSGHRGVFGNDRADFIATSYALGTPPLLYKGSFDEYVRLFGKAGVSETKAPKRKGEAYAYISLVDGACYSDQTWEACEKRVKGKKGAKFKKVFSLEEEKELVALWSK
jgi:ribonuclease HI